MMANESEFETVISEADVELGSVQPQMTSQEQDAPSNQVRIAPTGRWGIFSLNFLQQYFDVNTDDIKNRLIATFVPFKGKSLFEYTSEKADLYIPFCVAMMYPILLIKKKAKSTYLDNYLSSCASSIVLYGLLLCCCAAFLWFTGPIMGISMGVVSSISFSAYYILVAEIISVTPLLYLGLHMIYLCVITYFNFNKRFPEGKKAVGLAIMIVFSIVVGFISSYLV